MGEAGFDLNALKGEGTMKHHRLISVQCRFLPVFLLIYAIAGYGQPPVAVADGYAAGTTGGAGGTTTTVTNAAAFKSACESGSPMIVVVQGNLGDVGQIKCKSDKTIIGKDTTAGFTGNLACSEVSNIIVQNLHVANPNSIGTADGIEASTSCTKIFVTKCTFTDCADGSFDIKRGSDFLTVSWCRFRYPTISGHNFPNLLGHDDANASQDRGKLHITMHHNWYDAGCDQRMPRVRFGTVHVYNNFYGCANNSYCIGTGVECHIRVESCSFENVNNPWNDINGMANGGEIGWNNLKLLQATQPTYAPNKWPVFTPSYTFVMDKVDDIKGLVTDRVYGAGNRLSRSTVATAPHLAPGTLKRNKDSEGPGGAMLPVFDYSGKRVAYLESGEIDGRLPSGCYLVKPIDVNQGALKRIVTVGKR
jgi:pectate lyase